MDDDRTLEVSESLSRESTVRRGGGGGEEALEDENVGTQAVTDGWWKGGEKPAGKPGGGDAQGEGRGTRGIHDSVIVAEGRVDVERTLDHAKGEIVTLDVERREGVMATGSHEMTCGVLAHVTEFVA